MDVFTETLIKRKFTPADRKKIMMLFISLIASSILFIIVIPLLALGNGLPYITTASFIVFAILVFVIWRILKGMQLEFEYIITNDTLDVDKIIAQKKRARMISLELKTVEQAGRFTESSFEGRTFDCTIRAERNPIGHENFYLLLSHPSQRRTLIVFTPDEKMLAALHKTLPRQVAKNLPATLS